MTPRSRIGIPALLALLLLTVSACSTPPPYIGGTGAPHDPPRIADSFVSGGDVIGLEVIRGSGSGPLPAVVMLHGASGIGSGYMIYPYAGAISQRGMHVFVVHYYDGVHSGRRSSTANFPLRERIIADAVSHVRSRPEVDRSRVGLWGLSLGGFHALAHASRDQGIAAVVDLVGAMPQSVDMNRVSSFPPTLILHGANDRVVSPSRVATLASMLDRIGAHYQLKLYMGEGHSFGPEAHADSIHRTADFLDRHLNGRLLAMAAPRHR